MSIQPDIIGLTSEYWDINEKQPKSDAIKVSIFSRVKDGYICVIFDENVMRITGHETVGDRRIIRFSTKSDHKTMTLPNWPGIYRIRESDLMSPCIIM